MNTEIEAEYESDAGSTKTPHTFVDICEKIDRVITAPHCSLLCRMVRIIVSSVQLHFF